MKFPIKSAVGRVRFIRAFAIYYLEAERDDILVRTRSKRVEGEDRYRELRWRMNS